MFIRYNFFIIKMDKSDHMLDHINKVKSLAYQLICLEDHVNEEDVIMSLLNNLSNSFYHLITKSGTRSMKELMFDFITARLIYEVSKRKEKENQRDDMAWCSINL